MKMILQFHSFLTDIMFWLPKPVSKFKKPLVTTSYVQPEMKALDEEAKKAGIILSE